MAFVNRQLCTIQAGLVILGKETDLPDCSSIAGIHEKKKGMKLLVKETRENLAYM